ncbi:MAG: MarR family transcriptional regulator [Candidatus Thiothrix sulfatifontis]|nr:MAG: MarR family transcriptional regulator [Candidatus Thiothrix sulfatifontis]
MQHDTQTSLANIDGVFQLFVEVNITQMLATTEMTRVLPHKLTFSQFSLLSHFSRTENLQRSIVDLARIFQVTKPSMGETVDKLLSKGFVKVEANPADRREKIVSLTEQGAAAKLDAEKAIYPLLEAMLAQMGVAQFEAAYTALKPIRQWLDDNRNV